jgi:alkylated DNA repair dioxygenase AlkB
MIDLSNKQQNKSEPQILPFSLPSCTLFDNESYKYKWNNKLNGFYIKIPKGRLFYAQNFFNKETSDKYIQYFLENQTNDWHSTNWRDFEKEKLPKINFKNIDWQHDKLNMYGKEVYLPRYSAWYGDSDKPYTYSGLTLQPKKWTKGLFGIKKQIEKITTVKFNSVLMNWYRDGKDHMGWHADAEPELGKNPVIASINFGATRDFMIRKNDNPKNNTIKIPLEHGTLLIMAGEMQHFWQHSVPKRVNIQESRINLTFRIINH